jgi:hypothetical protein
MRTLIAESSETFRRPSRVALVDVAVAERSTGISPRIRCAWRAPIRRAALGTRRRSGKPRSCVPMFRVDGPGLGSPRAVRSDICGPDLTEQRSDKLVFWNGSRRAMAGGEVRGRGPGWVNMERAAARARRSGSGARQRRSFGLVC